MRRVGFLIVSPFLGYYAAASLTLLFFGIGEWWKKREEEGLLDVLADMAGALNRDLGWSCRVGVSAS